MYIEGKLIVMLFVLRCRFILGRDELTIAAHANKFREVQDYLSDGFNPNGDCKEGELKGSMTPLHYAILNHNLNMVQSLMYKNASVRCNNDKGQSVLHAAIAASHCAEDGDEYEESMDIIRELLKKDCDMQAVDLKGKTIIHYMVDYMAISAESENVDILEAVFWRGAYRKNMKDKAGLTPLAQIAQTETDGYQLQARHNQRELCNYLIEMGFQHDFDQLSSGDVESLLRMYWRPSFVFMKEKWNVFQPDLFDEFITGLAAAYMQDREGDDWRSLNFSNLVKVYEKYQMKALYVIAKKIFIKEAQGEIPKNYAKIKNSYMATELFSDTLQDNCSDPLKEAVCHLRRSVLDRVSWNLALAAHVLGMEVEEAERIGWDVLNDALESEENYSCGEDELTLAAKANNLEDVDCFLLFDRLNPNGECVEGKSKGKMTPLHYAILNRNLIMVQSLMDWIVSMRCNNDKGQSVLHAAIAASLYAGGEYEDCMNIIRELLKKDCDMQAVDLKGKTIIHYMVDYMAISAESENEDILEAVVWRGAYRKNMKDKAGLTPLAQIAQTETDGYQLQARHNQRELCNYLIEMGFQHDFDQLSSGDVERLLRMYWRPSFLFFMEGRWDVLQPELFDEFITGLAAAYMRDREGDNWRSLNFLNLVEVYENYQMKALFVIAKKIFIKEAQGEIPKNYAKIRDSYEATKLFSDTLQDNCSDPLKEAVCHLRRSVLDRVSWNLALAAHVLGMEVEEAERIGWDVLNDALESKKKYYERSMWYVEYDAY